MGTSLARRPPEELHTARFRAEDGEWQHAEVETRPRPGDKVLFEPFPKQQEFIDAVFSGEYSQLLYGGAIRGGKSYVLLALIFLLCRIYAGSRWAIVRKDLPTLRKNTLPVFEELRPDGFCRPFNQGTWTAKCDNGSEILLWAESATADPELNRWRGLEVNGFALEEMNELKEGSHDKAVERAGSWRARGGVQPPPLILGSCNPSDGWVKEQYYDPWEAGDLPEFRHYQPARIFDNPYVDPLYLESLKNLPEPAYRRFVLGDWTVSMDPMQLIQWEWVQAAIDGHWKSGELILRRPGPKLLGVDIARGGADKTIFSFFDGNVLYGMADYDALWLDEGAVQIVTSAHDEGIDAENVKVDGVGMGAGTVDICYAMKFQVREILAGNKPFPEPGSFFVFENRRDQMWWHVREMFRKGRLRISLPTTGDGPKLRKKLLADLTAIHYKVDSDRVFRVESREEIIKRIGRSPDYGSSFVHGLSKGAPRVRRPALRPTVTMSTSYV